jgi:hypothetical protein
MRRWRIGGCWCSRLGRHQRRWGSLGFVSLACLVVFGYGEKDLGIRIGKRSTYPKVALRKQTLRSRHAMQRVLHQQGEAVG